MHNYYSLLLYLIDVNMSFYVYHFVIKLMHVASNIIITNIIATSCDSYRSRLVTESILHIKDMITDWLKDKSEHLDPRTTSTLCNCSI